MEIVYIDVGGLGILGDRKENFWNRWDGSVYFYICFRGYIYMDFYGLIYTVLIVVFLGFIVFKKIS